MEYNPLERIIKECYWDYHISVEDLIAILSGDDVREKKQLFDKILTNSTERLYDIKKLFGKDLIALFLKDFNPKYNRDFC
jgi:hypothetical protein